MTGSLAQRVAQRFAAGALVVVVQEADEQLALVEVAAAAEPLGPVRILSAADVEAVPTVEAHATDGVGTLVVCDWFAIFGSNESATRFVRQVALQRRPDGERPSRLVLVEQSHTRIPAGCAGDVEHLKVPLPTVDELREELADFCDSQGYAIAGNGEARHALASAVSGLPRHEAARLFARCYVEHGQTLEPAWLRAEKARRVAERLGGALTFESTDGPDIGGADLLKRFLVRRGHALGSAAARAYGCDSPRGVFLAGGPGTGKSMFFKFAARQLGVPLLRFDVGRGFGSLVGETERNFRLVQEAAEACAPCLLLVDEVDKCFGGAVGSGGDSGTSSRAIGSFLTWAATKTAPVFLGATANRPWLLPAEFLRSGRFDAIFNLGAPSPAERADILRIHVERRGWKLPEAAFEQLAAASEHFTGAELEGAVIEAGFAAYADGARPINSADVLAAIEETVPIARTCPEDVSAMEKWSAGRAKPSSSAQVQKAAAPVLGRRRNVVGGA